MACLSVRLSVCLSQFGVLSKRLNMSSCLQRPTMAYKDCSLFSDAKDVGEIQTGSRQRAGQSFAEANKSEKRDSRHRNRQTYKHTDTLIAIFRPPTKEGEVVMCVVLNGTGTSMTLSDLEGHFS